MMPVSVPKVLCRPPGQKQSEWVDLWEAYVSTAALVGAGLGGSTGWAVGGGVPRSACHQQGRQTAGAAERHGPAAGAAAAPETLALQYNLSQCRMLCGAADGRGGADVPWRHGPRRCCARCWQHEHVCSLPPIGCATRHSILANCGPCRQGRACAAWCNTPPSCLRALMCRSLSAHSHEAALAPAYHLCNRRVALHLYPHAAPARRPHYPQHYPQLVPVSRSHPQPLTVQGTAQHAFHASRHTPPTTATLFLCDATRPADLPKGGVHQGGDHGGRGQQHDRADPVPGLP